ncbi:MAG TPA: hypothetical protein VFS32_12515 [Candidatus Limnocylindrales bacterium]|nr:hypothetical protein [Candidatus Limnocylindrales bacterium]
MTTRLVVGWATIDTERAAAGWPAGGRLGDDGAVGARALRASTVDGLVLLEPSTEGRLAASLARRGEGPAVVYVRTGRTAAGLRRAGLVLSAIAPGPFGPQALVLGGSRFGPHVIAVFDPASLDTIEP